MAQWVWAFATKLDNNKYTWWKERTNAYNVSSDLNTHART